MKLAKLLSKLKDLTPKCLICDSYVDSSLNNLITRNNFICAKCFDAMQPSIKIINVNGIKGISLFNYNEFTRNIILNIKVNKDLKLAKHILTPLSNYLNERYEGFTIVPVPSTDKGNKARGFNHVEAIFSQLKMPIQSVFTKSSDYKQSSVNFNDRELIKKYIKLKPDADLPKKILIVDDIITSGSSLKACLDLVRVKQDVKISFIVFSNNCRN
jgi:competence protein ComFC